MKNDYITIIIPVYNSEKYLNRCINSVLEQTYKYIKIILIDDGSKDNSASICDEYAKKYNNIKVIHKKNEGAGITRNVGLDLADTKYIGFVDSDDFIDKNMYELLYKKLIESNAQASFCGSKRIEKNGNIIINKTVKNMIFHKEEILERSIPYICSGEVSEKDLVGAVALWHGLYNLEVINKNNIRLLSEREIISEDTIFNLEYFIHCEKIAFVDQYLYNQYITEGSVSRGYNPKQILKFKNFYKIVNDFIKNNNIPNLDKNIIFLNRRYINLYKHEIAKIIKVNDNFKMVSKEIKQICNSDKILQNILKSKCYLKWTLKEKIFAIALKYKMYLLLRIIFRKR